MLEAKTIDLHYGAAQALRSVSLIAEPGKVTCVLGRNGVGKTSLLDALAGQQPVSRGSISFDGQDITTLKPSERARRGIAYVPQGREIFPLLTVEENLKTGFGPLKRDQRNIPDDVFSLFPVLGSMLGRRGGDLSGGQQQQLAIGRALAMEPKLLILDEPTEGIQPSIIKDIERAIRALAASGGRYRVTGSSKATSPAPAISASSRAVKTFVTEPISHLASRSPADAWPCGELTATTGST